MGVTTSPNAPATTAPASRGVLRRFRRQRLAMLALAFIAAMVVVAVFAGVLAPHDPNAQNLNRVMEGPSGSYPLGTDQLGRDVLSRLMYAARLSLLAAGIAVAFAVVIGLPIGLAAGYLGGITDRVVMLVTDGLMGFPPIILAVGVVGALGPGIVNAMIAVGIIYIPRTIRVARGAALAIRNDTYFEASRSIGTPTGRILRTHMLPNILPPVIVQVSLMMGFAMLAEASLSFLGLGAQPPDASWGSMLGSAARELSRQPWLMVWPGLAIALTVLAFNVLGDGLRDSFGRAERRG
ncbi:ABC transporter permease [Dactylosporangium salmoneum]|uniref:ABC transporter permease n=1 Tax=Dactylosporangium salmoneum TaxID=53361 RepID=A0ABN3GQI5_9ACTN